ncbi:MAG: universal stress protein [Chitinophagales bacterium]
MINKILVPVDFSGHAVNATEAAISLARLYECELIFYVVVKDLPDNANVENGKALSIEDRLNNLIGQFDYHGLDINKVFSSGKGDFIHAIEKYIANNNIDLVMMGSHGTSGPKNTAIGSNALKLIRSLPCPILIINERVINFGINRIVFISNFDNDNLAPFQQILKMITPFTSELHLLNIDTPGFFQDPDSIMKPAMETFQKYAEENGFICHSYRKSSGVVEQGINEFIEQVKPDMVLIPTHNRTMLQRLFVSSLAEAVINHVGVPVMTMKI